jgi:hypothetical protein
MKWWRRSYKTSSTLLHIGNQKSLATPNSKVTRRVATALDDFVSYCVAFEWNEWIGLLCGGACSLHFQSPGSRLKYIYIHCWGCVRWAGDNHKLCVVVVPPPPVLWVVDLFSLGAFLTFRTFFYLDFFSSTRPVNCSLKFINIYFFFLIFSVCLVAGCARRLLLHGGIAAYT